MYMGIYPCLYIESTSVNDDSQKKDFNCGTLGYPILVNELIEFLSALFFCFCFSRFQRQTEVCLNHN